jgi:hypothetical protein
VNSKRIISRVIAGILITGCLAAVADLQSVQVGGSIEIWGGNYTPFYEEDGETLHFPVPVLYRPLGPAGLASTVRADGKGSGLAFMEQRTRLHVQADFSDQVTGFIELESIDQWGEDFRSTYDTGADFRADSSDDLEIYQAYVESSEIFGLPLRLRLGRQEIVFGSGWLVGNNPYPDPFTGLSFDAVRATWSNDRFELDAWCSKLDERFLAMNDGDVDFYGVYGTYKFSEAVTADLYWMWLRDATDYQDTQGTPWAEFLESLLGRDDYGVTNLHTAGLRTAGEGAGFDWEVEAAYQWGNADALGALFIPVGRRYGDTRARWDTWAGHGEVGYTLDALKWTPRLYLAGHYYAGEDKRSISFGDWLNPFFQPSASVSFNRLFSDYEVDYFLDGSGLSNFWMANGGAQFTFTEALSGGIDIAYLQAVAAFDWPAELRWGSIHLPLASQLPFLDQRGSRDLGWSLTLSGEYVFSDNLKIEAAYAHFFVGEAIEDGVFVDGNGTLLIGGAGQHDADFVYWMATLTF